MIDLNDPNARNFFAAIIALFDCRVVVEIGVATGSTTPTLCRATKGKVYGYDLWDQHGQNKQFAAMGSMEQVRSMLHDQEFLDNFELHQVDTATDAFMGVLPDDIDFAFIDGDHSYDGAKNDFEKIYPRLADRCVIIFHDTLQIDGSRELMLDLERQHGDEFQFVNLPQNYMGTDYGMTMLVRNFGNHPIGEICGSLSTPEYIYRREAERFPGRIR
jgi:predicted O-methyltransferase YrrM